MFRHPVYIMCLVCSYQELRVILNSACLNTNLWQSELSDVHNTLHVHVLVLLIHVLIIHVHVHVLVIHVLIIHVHVLVNNACTDNTCTCTCTLY